MDFLDVAARERTGYGRSERSSTARPDWPKALDSGSVEGSGPDVLRDRRIAVIQNDELPPSHEEFALGVYVALPAVLVAGWVRWARRRQIGRTWPSLTGFSMGTASAMLAIGAMVYAGMIGGFMY